MAVVDELYPICRSITGDGVRETLASCSHDEVPLEVHEVPSGNAGARLGGAPGMEYSRRVRGGQQR